MAKNKNQDLIQKEIYAEIGTNYRFFLNWRHALFAGYLLVLYALINAYLRLSESSQGDLNYVVFSIGLLLSVCFWGLEIRIRDLYRACTRAGHKLENLASESGIYTELDNQDLINRTISHSRVLNWFYGIISIGMFAMLIYSICQILR
jgi:hypothetical protein